MAQLVRIGAVVNWRQGFEKNPQDSNEESMKENEEDEEAKEKLEKSQEETLEGTLLLVSY